MIVAFGAVLLVGCFEVSDADAGEGAECEDCERTDGEGCSCGRRGCGVVHGGVDEACGCEGDASKRPAEEDG